MEKQLELAVAEVVGIAEQLITLSSAILVLSIGFVKDVLKTPQRSDRGLLAAAWAGYLLAIVAGIWTRMAVAGTLAASTPVTGLGSNVRLPAGIQILLFLLATAVFISLAIRGIGRQQTPTSGGAAPSEDPQQVSR